MDFNAQIHPTSSIPAHTLREQCFASHSHARPTAPGMNTESCPGHLNQNSTSSSDFPVSGTLIPPHTAPPQLTPLHTRSPPARSHTTLSHAPVTHWFTWANTHAPRTRHASRLRHLQLSREVQQEKQIFHVLTVDIFLKVTFYFQIWFQLPRES